MDRGRAAAALLALAACITCSAAAPTAGNHTALELHDGPVEGCYYNFQHYGEGDRIMTNEPCLNCTCHNRMLMCYLRVCPFTKAIGQDCTVEKRADQCCPIVTCPDVPVDLLTSTSTSSPAEYGATGLGKLDKYGCSIHGKYFPEGAKVPPTPNKPCEHCYCIRNMTTCVMQECTLHVDGCTPIYHKDVCCPVRYSCDHPEDEIPLLDDMTTTVRPTQGFLLTTTTMAPVTQMSQDCIHDDQIFSDGALIKTEKACEHCYCMKGDIVCVVQECGTPMENEGKNCTSLPPRHGQCCPDTYICEGDELVTDSTTEFVELTSSPPRRVSIEGSGYRNEPDEPYTEMSPAITDIEGSGEDFATGSQIDTGENTTPEKEVIDETLLKLTTESNLHLSQSTEPDKGQNTIPDSVIDKETAQEPTQDKATLSGLGSMTTASEEYTTTGISDAYLTSRKDEISTTESVPKEDEKRTTDSTDLLIKTTSTDELILHTNPVIIEPVQKATTSPSTEYTTKVQESSEQEEISTEILDQSSVTEKNKFTDVLQTSPEAEIFIELTTNTITNLFTAESTSINPNINEIDDIVSPASSPSRIPGEGDCLLNGITYTNNTNVPSTNNCHTGCKCISSIIKCDPIICSPPPEYMENMNDCQPVYDTPNSCCPTYVCSVKETIPPESHSHMSGTESPKPIAPNECSGNDCLDNEDKKMPMEPTICTSGNCLSESPTVQKECESNDCKDQAETSQPVPSQDCSNGKCQILPVKPCEGENCKIEPLKDTVFEKDLESTKTPAIQDNCESGDCNDQVTTPSQPSQDCSNGKCELETPCESENCKIQPTKETIYEKDSEPSSHVVPDIDVPTKVCNKENGCDENNVIEPEECVSESCRRKDFAETGEKVPLKCIGTDCKQHDEPTVQSTEQPIDIVTEGSTVSDINLQKTESIESHITTTKEKLTKPDIDVTKQPIYIESTEKLSTIFEQIDTESPTKYYTEKEAIQTDIPLIQTGIEKAEEAATEILQTETPKLSVAETTESLGSVSHIGERLTTEIDISYTKSPEYLETETIPGQNEQLSTKTPHIYTEDGTVLDEDHTKLPQIPLSEIEKSPTEAPELIIPETSGINTEFSETITEKINQKEEFVTKLPEIFRTEKETVHPGATETSFSATEATQTTVSKETISETQTIPENSEGVTEKEVKETKIPESLVTEKEQLQTEVTETITDREDTQTKTPELFATEKEVIVTEASRVTAADKDIIQTESPEIIVAPEPSPTESSEKINTEPQTIQTESPDVAVITKEHTEMEIPKFTEATQTIAPDETITKKDEVPTDIIEIATEKEIIKVSSPDQHDMTIESTTGHESPVEGHTIVNLNPVTNEAESYATKESIFEPQATITAIPEKIGEENKYDESYKPRPTKSEDIPTEDKTEIATEPIESDVSKTVTMAEETYAGVTELITQPTLLEVTSEITTKETYKVTSEEQEMYTKSPQVIGTNAEEKEVTTDKNLLYTSRPDETKSDDVSQAIDKSFTESQVIVTKAPEILTSQYVHISTVHDVIVTDSDKESPDTATEPTSLLTNEITDKQEKHTEAPEIHSTILQAEDKTTKLPELYTTLVEELMTPEKSPEKPYETPISELEKDEKYTTDQIYLTTLKSVEELTTTESSKLMTLTPILSTEPQQQQSSTDQKLDSEYPHLTTKTEGSNKEPETSTDILERVTEITKAHPDHPKITEEIEEDLTTKITEPDIVTETYKETTSDNLPSQFTYKDELPTEIQQTISQETSYTKADSEPIVETSTKTILEKEKEQSQETTTITSQITQSSDKDEFESALPFTKTPEPEFVTEKDTVTYTIKGEGKDDTEKDGSEPFISDEKPSDTTEESGLLGVHKPDHTDNDSLTTQTSMPNVADTSKNVQNSEMSTENPESITMLEQITLDMKDSVTTESHLSYTSSDDKLSTTASDDKEIQEKQESDYSDLKTTSSITELPMSQVTHIDHASSLQTTLTDKGEIAEQPYKTTVELKLEEEKAQTPLFELPKQSTETPDYHITQQEMEVESSSKLTVEDLNNLEVDNAEKTTMSSMEPKTTAIPHQQTDFSKDVSTDRTISDLYNQNTEETPTSDIKEGIIDTQSQKTTTVSLPSEKETNLSHEQETPSTESVAEIVTKSPHETQTVLEENAMTSSILLDEGHIKETMSTEALPTEQHGLVTEYPEKNVDDMPSTLPEKETSESEGLTGTEPTKISIEKESESDTSLYVPVVTELTERPIPVVTEVSQPDITEKDHRRTEIEIKSEEKTTTHVNLDEVTEKDILYTESKPLYTTEAQNIATQQKEINTEALDRATTVPDQVITQSLSTGVPERDESYGTTDSVDKDKTYEHISPQSTTQMPEISSLITETQTKATGMEKTTLTVQTLSEQEEQSLSVTVKEEAESQPEKYNTQSTIENESGITEATADSSKETDKEVPDLHRPTELTPTTLESFYPQAQTTQTHKEFDKSDEPKQTTEPGHEFSETTPFLVELKEHTHQVIDDSSRTPIEEILTTPLYEPQQTERGDQNLDVTDKYEDETLVPITATEYEQEDKEKPHGPEQVEEKISTTTSTVKDYTEHISDTDISPTTSSTYLETGLQEKEKQYITAQDEVLTTSAAPQTTSEKELHTTITTDEKITYPVTETSSISTEKEHLVTDKPLKSETSMGTTLLDEDLLQETSKSTSKIKEESTTHSSLTDKFTQLEEKPIKPTPSPPTQELTKPAFDDEINEGIPSPDFPPSGTGGYGQEPDYIEEDQAFGPGTCRYGGKVYVSAQQIPRDDPCDFCFCFRSDIICLQQSCPPPIHGCHEEPIQGFCCPRYECPVSMATTLNVTTTTTSTTTTLPPHFLPHAYKGAAQRRGCQIKGHTYKVGEVVRASSGPCLVCTCGGDGQMKCDPKACTPEPMLRQMIAAAVSAKRRR